MSDFSWNGGAGRFNQASKWTDLTNPGVSGANYPKANDIANFATNGSLSGTVTTMMVELAIIASFTANITAVSIFDYGTITVASGGVFTTSGETHLNGLLSLQDGGDLAAAAGNSLLANIEVDAGGTLTASGSGSTINPTVGGVVVGAAMPFSDGTGLGWQNQSTSRNATIGRKETVLASHGFSSALRKAPFIGGPHACSAPATRISG
jgi:hypothetical protein